VYQIVTLNLDAYPSIQLELDVMLPFEAQLSDQLLVQFDLSSSQIALLKPALVAGLADSLAGPEFVLLVQIDHDVLAYQREQLPIGAVRVENDGYVRLVYYQTHILLTISKVTKAAYQSMTPVPPKVTRRGAPFSFSEDQGLCQKIVRMCHGAPKLALQFFEDHVVDRVDEVQGRPSTSLMMRYNNHLQSGLLKELERCGGSAVQFDWLRQSREAALRPYSLEEHQHICEVIIKHGVIGKNLSESQFEALMPNAEGGKNKSIYFLFLIFFVIISPI
jgi:hypothetical protein